MSFRYFATRRDAARYAQALESVTGRHPSTFIETPDGSMPWGTRASYRVQDDALGNDWADAVESLLATGVRADRISESQVFDLVVERDGWEPE